MKQYLLGIDVGTTGTKTLLFSIDGELKGHAYRAYPTQTPNPGWSEQNAADWWNAVAETVRETCGQLDREDKVAAISLSLQGGTMVAVDENLKQVRPAMVWSDNRCAEQARACRETLGNLYQKTGWWLGRGLNALQIRWMKDNEPELFERTAMFLSVPDYISCKMTGIATVDLSDVGINQLADVRKGIYDPEILEFAGITEEKLPRIVRSGEKIGHLTEEAAKELGLTTETVLVAGAHDQYAVALGAGAVKEGDILIGSGTAWVITAIGDEPDFESGLSQSVAAVPGKWGSLWSLSSGGVCLEWWRRNLTEDTEGSRIPYDTINAEVARRKGAEDGLFFFPFSGRASLKKGFTRATFVGLALSHDKFDMARAVMEGVAFQIVWMMDAFKTKPSREGLKLTGGATKSELWCQMVADIANLPVRIPEVADMACVGAAILAGVGCGLYKDAEEGYSKLAVRERVIYPNAERAENYRSLFETYKHHAEILGELYNR